MAEPPPFWLSTARHLQAIAQTGLHFTRDDFDRERFESVLEIAASILNRYEHDPANKEKPLNLWRRESGYATPKIGVRGAVFRDNRILLVQERFDGLWSLPGGWCDVGLTPSENIIKEISEESGIITCVKRLIAVFDDNKHPHTRTHLFHTYMMLFLCGEEEGGTLAAGLETLDADFFAADSLPPLSLARVTPGQIALCFQAKNDPDFITRFD